MIPIGRINESQLAKRLRVSRTPLREALVSLEREGFVISEKRGFAVPPLREREIQELYPIMGTLEGLALRLSSGFEVAHLKRLRAANRVFQRTAGSAHRALAADHDFHQRLLANCPNRRLLATIERQKLLVRRYEIIYFGERGFLEQSVRQHSQIVDALERDDRSAAIEILDQNWQATLQMVLTSPHWPD
jgi:DNA-binding GntR family transcriptional regulator